MHIIDINITIIDKVFDLIIIKNKVSSILNLNTYI